MSVESSKFEKLKELARETSSEKRRDLLREVTDIFFDDSEDQRSESECVIYDEIIVAVANDMTEQVRKDLSTKVAKSRSPLRRTAKRLATDTIAVARPVLQHADTLTDSDLIEIVNSKPQSHLMAVSKRRNIGEGVSEALVNKGEDPVLASLLQNDTAKINRKSYETITERAKSSPILHEPLVKRQTVPLDLLHEMYDVVEKKLRAQVMTRFENVSEAELSDALSKSRARLSAVLGGQPDDLEDARKWLKTVIENKTLQPPTLVALLRNQERTRFMCALSYIADMPFSVVHRLVKEKDLDALAILCRSAKLEKPLFASIAVIIIGGDNGVAQANKFAAMYEEVTPMAAQRAVRFWKVRNTSGASQKSNAA